MGQSGNSTDLNAEFLAHYGVKGMKWGVLRGGVKTVIGSVKSDPDAAIKKTANFAKDIRKTKVRTKEQAIDYVKTAAEHKRVNELRLKQKLVGVQSLSNKDLQEVITRMNLEMQYKNLKKAEFEDSYLGAGTKFVTSVLKDAATDAASSWAKRPGSNFSGRSSGRGGSFVGRSIDGTVVQRMAIGS